MEEDVVRPEKPVKPKSRSSSKQEDAFSLRDIDPKRFLIGIVVIGLVMGGLAFWAKDNLPRFLSAQQERLAQRQMEKPGIVAGESDINLNGLQEQIDGIKKDVLQLKADDIKNQEPVQKILNDLDALARQASQSAKVFDVKGNVCEEVKKRFCE